MPIPKAAFIWHELTTVDAKAALAFYSHVVGLTSKPMLTAAGATYHILEAGGRGIGGVVEASGAQRDAGMLPGWVGYLSSQDVDSDLVRLKQLGGKVDRPAEDIPNVGRFAPVSDPQGARFLVFKPQPPPGGVPPRATGVGSVGWAELHTTDWKAAFAFYSELCGWQKAEAVDMGALGTYQTFSAGAAAIGGMMNSPDRSAAPHWLYYFHVEAIDAALARVKDKGGQATRDPSEVPNGWIVQCHDPQGAGFALVADKR